MRKQICLVGLFSATAFLTGCVSQSVSDISASVLPAEKCSTCQFTKGETHRLNGTLIIGHEVRTFKPMGCEEAFWVVDLTGTLYARYDSLTKGVKNGLPVNASLVVESAGKAADGFAKEYPAVFKVQQIISMSLK